MSVVCTNSKYRSLSHTWLPLSQSNAVATWQADRRSRRAARPPASLGKTMLFCSSLERPTLQGVAGLLHHVLTAADSFARSKLFEVSLKLSRWPLICKTAFLPPQNNSLFASRKLLSQCSLHSSCFPEYSYLYMLLLLRRQLAFLPCSLHQYDYSVLKVRPLESGPGPSFHLPGGCCTPGAGRCSASVLFHNWR